MLLRAPAVAVMVALHSSLFKVLHNNRTGHKRRPLRTLSVITLSYHGLIVGRIALSRRDNCGWFVFVGYIELETRRASRRSASRSEAHCLAGRRRRHDACRAGGSACPTLIVSRHCIESHA